MSPSVLDRDLVSACLTGDERAWEALIQRYERLLYAIPRRCGLSQDDAADVFQTVCVRLIENLEQLRHHDCLARWLITTTSREAWRVQRQSRRHLALPESDPDTRSGGSREDTLPSTDPLPHDALVQLEEEQMVRQALQLLHERCRTLLRLLYFMDPAPSYAEIARQLGLSEGSIGPARARCLEQLKKILREMGF